MATEPFDPLGPSQKTNEIRDIFNAPENPPTSPEKDAGDQKSQGGLPEAIKANRPYPALNMTGPLAAAVDRMSSKMHLEKDRAATNKTRSDKYSDKEKSSLVLSKHNVRDGTKEILGKEFEKDR